MRKPKQKQVLLTLLTSYFFFSRPSLDNKRNWCCALVTQNDVVVLRLQKSRCCHHEAFKRKYTCKQTDNTSSKSKFYWTYWQFQLRDSTNSDPTLNTVIETIIHGWPENIKDLLTDTSLLVIPRRNGHWRWYRFQRTTNHHSWILETRHPYQSSPFPPIQRNLDYYMTSQTAHGKSLELTYLK